MAWAQQAVAVYRRPRPETRPRSGVHHRRGGKEAGSGGSVLSAARLLPPPDRAPTSPYGDLAITPLEKAQDPTSVSSGGLITTSW